MTKEEDRLRWIKENFTIGKIIPITPKIEEEMTRQCLVCGKPVIMQIDDLEAGVIRVSCSDLTGCGNYNYMKTDDENLLRELST